ncbi:unnamed protein product [Peniophora sp. CBMAI 1063]|nr:unnamed protein product [Peniophora sp. CBMAI 1063]
MLGRLVPFLKDHASASTALAAGVASLLIVWYFRRSKHALPPGPTQLSVLVNTFRMRATPWLQFTTWQKEYGNLYYFEVLGQGYMVLGSRQCAIDLLDRRASLYSDRPRLIMASEFMSRSLLFPFSVNDDRWHRMRKAASVGLSRNAVKEFHGRQIAEACLLARAGLRDPALWDRHIRRATASTMLTCVYNESPLTDENDGRIDDINDFGGRRVVAATPGSHLVEVLPWIAHMPAAIASWKRKAQMGFIKDNEMLCRLFERALSLSEGGVSSCSILTSHAEDYGMTMEENAWVAGALYGGGTETTHAILTWWSLAMLAYPDIQRQAQAELDRVVGRMRAPTFADLPSLPYIEAMVKEAIRWSCATPLGVPHRSTEDDHYNDYFVPKGTIVIPNIWKLHREPTVYGADSDEFDPKRFLRGSRTPDSASSAREISHLGYGFGRRVCVGRYMADNTLFINIATCLWALSMSNPAGQELDVEQYISEGLVILPKPFAIDTEPRFPEVPSLLPRECELRSV